MREEINSLDLRKAIRNKYAWPGGYEIFGICNDGAVLCCDCMEKEYFQIAYSRKFSINDGWRVLAVDCAANYDEYIYCEHCNHTIVDRFNEE
jgi:hypothetical protein